MSKLKIAYFGTPSFSAQFLELILNDKNLPVEIVLVVTQPDKPVGRNHILTPSPVKEVAKKHNIRITYNSSDFIKAIGGPTRGAPTTGAVEQDVRARVGAVEGQNLSPTIDLSLLFAYGEMIPKDLLTIPRLGFWNIHPSLLPAYRGASPITYPILLGDAETGVTLMQMDDQLDHGPIIAQEKIKILPNDRRTDLEDKLTQLAFHVFKVFINPLTHEPVNALTLTKQDDSLATFTRQLKKSDGFIPFKTLKRTLAGQSLLQEESPQILQEYYSKNNPAIKQFDNATIYNLFRSLYPWPGIWTLVMINGFQKRLKITDMEMKNNTLFIAKVQLEGKNEVDFETFKRAYNVF